MMRRTLALLAVLSLGAGCTAPAQPPPASASLQSASAAATDCDNGAPCYYGALPAYFEDFDYTSDRLPAEAPNSGSIFGTNAWVLGADTVQTRGWYRFNRNDLPVPGEVAFEQPSTLTLRLPAGLHSADYHRAAMLFSGASLEAGTYAWRVRYSRLDEEARGRHTVWLYTTQALDFVRVEGRDTTRYHFAPELDYENENQFERAEPTGRVTRMAVTNHAGLWQRGSQEQRLSHAGPAEWHEGRGVLARSGPGTNVISRPAPVADWAERWMDVLLVVDSLAQTVTFRMTPAELRPGDPLGWLAEHRYVNGPDFYPLMPLTPAFSVHWHEPEGRLGRPIQLDVQWIYHTPVLGLSFEDVRAQVERLQRRGLVRVNTTGRPTFEPRGEPERLRLALAGPEAVGCDGGRWRLRLWPGGGRYQATLRYRTHTDDGPGAWRAVYSPALTLRPEPGTRRVELEATVQDAWQPNGTRVSPDGWPNPRPGNYTASAHRTVAVTCR